ncbi:MAG: YHS domain-containing (seleno)protein [Microcystaceae cyanobacterium]
MRLLLRPSSILIVILGLVVGCAPSPPESVLDQPTPQVLAYDAESSSPVGGTLSAANEPETVFAEDGIAIRGADPVAYFTQDAYVAGSREYTYDWGGATWLFANGEHRNLFISNPEQYAPQYGGFCAWAVSEGYIAPVDPTAWDIVDGKLYLNFNARIQRRWQRDIPGHVKRANQNWPRVQGQ